MAHGFGVELGTDELLCKVTAWELWRVKEECKGAGTHPEGSRLRCKMHTLAQEVGTRKERGCRNFEAIGSAAWLTNLLKCLVCLGCRRNWYRGAVCVDWHAVEVISLWARGHYRQLSHVRKLGQLVPWKRTHLGTCCFVGLSLVGACFSIL